MLVWQAEDRCATVPSNPGNPPDDDVEEAGEADSSDSTAVNIGAPACGTIPTTVVETTQAGRPGIEVTVKASQVAQPAAEYIALAKRYTVSWDDVPAPAAAPRVFRVDFDTMRVWNDSEPCGEDGEWVVTLRANERWIHPVRGHGDDDDAFWESGAVDDDLCDGGDVDFKDYKIGEELTVTVPSGQPVNVWARGWDNDTFSNDFIPVINDFRSGPGSFSTRRGIDGSSDWEIFYRITDVTPTAPTAGALTIGNPVYGPNADTGGAATRVSAVSTLELHRQRRRFAAVAGLAGGWRGTDDLAVRQHRAAADRPRERARRRPLRRAVRAGVGGRHRRHPPGAGARARRHRTRPHGARADQGRRDVRLRCRRDVGGLRRRRAPGPGSPHLRPRLGRGVPGADGSPP